MLTLTFLGLAAACCTTGAFLPQVVKTWKTRSTNDISLSMFSLMVFGIALWLAYGILLADVPLIVANAITFVLAGLFWFLSYDTAKKGPPTEAASSRSFQRGIDGTTLRGRYSSGRKWKTSSDQYDGAVLLRIRMIPRAVVGASCLGLRVTYTLFFFWSGRAFF